jgi:hypothetical protein
LIRSGRQFLGEPGPLLKKGREMRRAQYLIMPDESNDEQLVIRDLGPWNHFPTVTNDAENVVADLAGQLNGRKLLYYDSNGRLDELLVRDGRFVGFAPGPVSKEKSRC